MDAIRENMPTLKSKRAYQIVQIEILVQGSKRLFLHESRSFPVYWTIESFNFDAIEIILSRADAADVVMFPYSNFCSSNFNSIGIFLIIIRNITARNKILNLFLNIIDKYYKSVSISQLEFFLIRILTIYQVKVDGQSR